MSDKEAKLWTFSSLSPWIQQNKDWNIETVIAINLLRPVLAHESNKTRIETVCSTAAIAANPES